MAGPAYERLSAQDSSFLLFERRATPMHVAAIAIFEAGPLATADGGLDAGRIGKYVESRLPLLPRYRQRIRFTPLAREPIWVDDPGFDLRYHLRRAALPRPGTEGDLKELVGRILSHPLDRERPLWEMWIVEGIEGGRFALISKIHHCMVDGVSGMNLLTLLFQRDPRAEVEPTPGWSPRPAPSPLRLLADGGLRRAVAPLAALRDARRLLADPRAALERLVDAGTAVGEALGAGLRIPSPSPLNAPIGPHRRIDWRALDLARMKQVGRRLGGTVNDVVLATTAGALRAFLEERTPLRLRFDFRIVIPVNMRPEGDDGTAANRVSAFFLSLPIAEPDPLARFARIRAETERLKGSRAAAGIDLLTRLADASGAAWLTSFGVGLVSRLRPYNLIVTNVPGPQLPLYVLGAPLREVMPALPLFEHQTLGIAVLSYHGRVFFGLTGERERIDDLDRLAAAIEAAFDELAAAASA
jgi:WS/DGAT/MGAT family acyltransferase